MITISSANIFLVVTILYKQRKIMAIVKLNRNPTQYVHKKIIIVILINSTESCKITKQTDK